MADSIPGKMQLGALVIKDNVTLSYILKPSLDIIFTLREIDDKVRLPLLVTPRLSPPSLTFLTLFLRG